MTTIRLRPTFSISTTEDTAETMARVSAAIKQQASGLSGQFRGGHAMISIVESKRHFWSPWLHLDVREMESDRQLVGRFSPHPSIWTAFMFSYLSLVVLAFFSLIIGSSQQIAGQQAWGFVLLPVCLLIAVVLWLISQAGQRLAQNEMQTMKSIVISSVDSGLIGTVTFRPFRASDTAACLRIFDANCPEYFAANERMDYEKFLNRLDGGYEVCELDQSICGAFGLLGDQNSKQLNWILIDPRCQGMGIGKKIMNRVIELGRAARAPVIHIAASQKSSPFFARFGATVIKTTQDGWGIGLDRVDMELPLGRSLPLNR